MTLKTLGGLGLAGSSFARPKPLLLLAYLSLEGPQERRHLAELFWPKNADALNSLSVALSRLRSGVPGAVEADEVRVWTPLDSDAKALLQALERREYATAIALYEGAFVEGVDELEVELEEWVLERREGIAKEMLGAYLHQGELEAAKGRFETATRQAESAFGLKHLIDIEPETLRRLYPLLLLSASPKSAEVRQLAAAEGIQLNQTPAEARAQFQSNLLGREAELSKLSALPPGHWLWLRGGAGMGKTVLLQSLEGTYLLGRMGLPYATLEPLLGNALGEGEELLLRKLAKLEGTLLLDNWEHTDPESQNLLRRLRGLRPNLRVVLASRQDPPFEVDELLELAPLKPEALSAHPGAFEATGGLPALVGAYLRGEPMGGALETRLRGLDKPTREVGLALALLDEPDLALVRRALGLGAAEMAAALDGLWAAGLMERSGQLRVRQALLDWLGPQQTLAAGLAVRLARLLASAREGIAAYPLWDKAKLLWEEGDTPKVQESYIAWAKELLRRGFPARAVEALEKAPKGREVQFWLVRCLERGGRYPEAIALLQNESSDLDMLALKGNLYWRLGEPALAEQAASKALHGSIFARAEALNVLGNVSLDAGNFDEAQKKFNRAVALFRTINEPIRLGESLNNTAIAQTELGENAEKIFQEALQASTDPILRARVYTNLGKTFEKNGEFEKAERAYKEALQIAETTGTNGNAAKAWNNLGVLHHVSGKHQQAREAYENAISLARLEEESFLLATVLANLSELTNNFEALQEALIILDKTGNAVLAQRFRERMTTMSNPMK